MFPEKIIYYPIATDCYTGTVYQKDVDAGFDSFNVSLFMLIAFSFVPAAWMAYIVREKETKCKHQQVTGLSRSVGPVKDFVYCQLFYCKTF